MDMTSLVASWDWIVLTEILGVNLILSGDNAVLIALAAAGLPAEQRGKAIMFGMVLAVVLRIVLSILAVQLLAIPGLLLVGGLLLLWIAYTFFRELRSEAKAEGEGLHGEPAETKTLATALRQIVIADVSMSLDNVLAVAGAAHGNMPMLILGLAISIVMMGVAATLISRLLERYKWIAYVGVALIVWIGAKMIWEDVHRLTEMYGGGHAALQRAPALVLERPGAAPAIASLPSAG
jgi:YjbE family integral membrane protein